VSAQTHAGDLDLSAATPAERGDAARNRRRLLDAARRLVVERGAAALTMDELARTAGVGKGTVFRRFGSRANLMMVLLDEDERASQQAFMYGPPPLGPAAEPLQRLVAFGRMRIRFAHTHHALLSAANRDPRTRHNAPTMVSRTHIRVLLESAGTSGDLDVQADALLALLDADYVEYQLGSRGLTLVEVGDAWEDLARKLCGR
jgi:AcrR family transcriptional regulator